MVRTGTVVRPGSDAAVFHVREANKFLAATTDCNSLYCRLDPREGARIAVAEAARNLTCSGAVPLAVTDNLNFGNPYKPENFWQLREAVEGLAEACRAFDTPVTGGNVSLYNESPAGVVDPTPTVAMVGLIEREEWITTQYFKAPASRDLARRLRRRDRRLAFSQGHPRPKAGRPPRLDFARELAVHNALRELIRAGLSGARTIAAKADSRSRSPNRCFNPDGFVGRDDRSGRCRCAAARSNSLQRNSVADCHFRGAGKCRGGFAVAGATRFAGASPRHGRWRRAGNLGRGRKAALVRCAKFTHDWYDAIANAVRGELTTS